MRVLLKQTLNCTPDAAWRAMRSPAVLAEVYSPLMELDSLQRGGFPTIWSEGEHPVYLYGCGLVPMGTQTIDLAFRRVPDFPRVRMLRDSGHPTSGILSLITRWEHKIAISDGMASDDTCLYRDQLVFSAGAATPLVWPVLWLMWQWRGLKLKRLASTWSLDLGADQPL